MSIIKEQVNKFRDLVEDLVHCELEAAAALRKAKDARTRIDEFLWRIGPDGPEASAAAKAAWPEEPQCQA